MVTHFFFFLFFWGLTAANIQIGPSVLFCSSPPPTMLCFQKPRQAVIQTFGCWSLINVSRKRFFFKLLFQFLVKSLSFVFSGYIGWQLQSLRVRRRCWGGLAFKAEELWHFATKAHTRQTCFALERHQLNKTSVCLRKGQHSRCLKPNICDKFTQSMSNTSRKRIASWSIAFIYLCIYFKRKEDKKHLSVISFSFSKS